MTQEHQERRGQHIEMTDDRGKQGDDDCREDMYFGNVKSLEKVFEQKCHCEYECLFDFSVQVCCVLYLTFPLPFF